jgi:hypothetical protein
MLGILEADKDGVILRGQVTIFSFDFVVREPDELRAVLQKHSVKLANLAKTQS